MITPADSPEPNSSQAGPPVEEKRRSKRMYVLWGVALSTLVALGLVCWLVVVPVWQVRSVVMGLSVDTRRSSLRTHYIYYHGDVREHVQALGGEKQALRKLRFYAKLPETFAPRRHIAILLMGECGPGAEPLLVEYADKKTRSEEREAAINALWRLQDRQKQEKK